jgi:hypothetical protein
LPVTINKDEARNAHTATSFMRLVRELQKKLPSNLAPPGMENDGALAQRINRALKG